MYVYTINIVIKISQLQRLKPFNPQEFWLVEPEICCIYTYTHPYTVSAVFCKQGHVEVLLTKPKVSFFYSEKNKLYVCVYQCTVLNNTF